MAGEIERRDFFISFNSADLAYAAAIDAALRAAGFTTFYYPNDLRPGGSIPEWMDEALMNSAQTLALYSPDYIKQEAAYSRAEHHASWWQEPGNDKRKLIPVIIRETPFTPLISVLSRIEVIGTTPDEAAAEVVRKLRAPTESRERDHWRTGLPLPKIFKALYLPNPNFTGRFEAMESLQKSLRNGNAAITAVEGMGGIGKTTLAAEYCHRFGSRYGGVWWVRAEQESVLLSDLVELGQRLKLDLTGNIEADSRATLDHLAARTEPWLMVYDNAPHPDGVSKWLPRGAVRSVITSRFAGFGGIANVTSLDQWSGEVTMDYLLSRTGRDDKAGALRLAHTLGGLPLAAEQAAVFLRDRNSIDFDDYAKEIRRLIKEPRPAGSKGEYPDTVYAAFVKSLAAIEGMKGDKTALDIIRLCAFLSPDGVDLWLLTSTKGGKYLPADFVAAITEKFTQADALAALASLSLLRQESGSTGPVLIFHRLLLEVVRDWMGIADHARWSGVAAQLVNAVFPYDSDDDPKQWPLCARLMPHVAPLEEHAPRMGEGGRALSRLLNQACIYLAARGDRAGALVLARQNVAVKRAREEEPLLLATGLANMAALHGELDQFDEAEAAYHESLAIQEPRVDRNDPGLAATLSNLGALHMGRNEFTKAEPLLLRAAEISKTAHGTESAQYSIVLSNLGQLYSHWADKSNDLTRRAQAEDFLRKEFLICQTVRGPRHPETAISHSNIAIITAKNKDLPGAEAETLRALAIMLSLDLPQHPFTQVAANYLMSIWRQSGELEKTARLARGEISDLLPAIAQIEADHRKWVAEDPRNRHFGPPSAYG